MPLSELLGCSAMMRHRIFFSFHYALDAWRVAQVRKHCARSLIANDWESAKLRSKSSIAHWIDTQMGPAECTLVLIGSETSDREWVNYEVSKSWNDGKGILGIYIHALRDQYGKKSFQGTNPLEKVATDEFRLSDVVKTYQPRHEDRGDVCSYINRNIAGWIEDAILIRNQCAEGYARPI